MRLKQIALATLFAAVTALPAMAQPKPAPATATMPAMPAMPVKPATTAPAAVATPAAKTATKGKIVKSTTAIVNINTGTAEQLQTIKGVGKSTAAKIIAGRPYKAVTDLDTKKTIPHATYTKLKGQFSI